MLNTGLLLVSMVLFIAGCDKPDHITVYKVPKAQLKTQMTNHESHIGWVTPKEWRSQSKTPMRLASFTIDDLSKQDIDISISSFPGDVGSLLANVNRWRGQLGLTSIKGQELHKVSVLRKFGKTPMTFVRLASIPDNKSTEKLMMVAIYKHANNTYFFKMIGKKEVISKQESTFIKFLESIYVKH